MPRKKAKVTVLDIAKKARVSTATVSRAFNGTGIVNPDTYQNIMEAAQELGYTLPPSKSTPSPQYSTQKSKKYSFKRLILVIIPAMSNPFYSEIINGIQSSMLSNEFEFLLYSKEIKESTVDSFLDFVDSMNVSGLIVLSLVSNTVLPKITEHIPVVQCCEYTDNPYASSVGINDYTSTQTAMEYFLSMGRKKIGLINGPLTYKYAQNRLDAYKAIMKAAKIEDHPEWIIQLPDLSHDMAFSSVVKLLTTENPPDCFFAVSDVLAAAAIRAVQYCNLRVPEDVLIIGFDNTIISQLTTPSITTINQPKFQLGFLAGELLFEKINNPLSPIQHMKLSTELIIRESTSSSI